MIKSKRIKFFVKIIAVLIILATIMPNIVVYAERNGKKVVALDVGHLNADSGAVGNGLVEVELTKETVEYMQKYLEQYSDEIEVIICDTSSLSGRPQSAKNAGADVHISVHFNSAGSTATGIEVIYKLGDIKSKSFGDILLSSTAESTGLPKRRVITDMDTGRGPFSIINDNIGCPSVIIEGGFISNPTEAAFLKQSENIKKLSAGAVSAILKYLGITDKGYPDIPNYTGFTGNVSGGGVSTPLGTITTTSREEKFLGLWKNSKGYYIPYYQDPSNAKYNKDGIIVNYFWYGSPVSALYESADMFFYLLESSERTQQHSQIMKYLMHKYDDNYNFGVDTLDLNIFDIENFTSMSGSGGSIYIEFLKGWENEGLRSYMSGERWIYCS